MRFSSRTRLNKIKQITFIEQPSILECQEIFYWCMMNYMCPYTLNVLRAIQVVVGKKVKKHWCFFKSKQRL